MISRLFAGDAGGCLRTAISACSSIAYTLLTLSHIVISAIGISSTSTSFSSQPHSYSFTILSTDALNSISKTLAYISLNNNRSSMPPPQMYFWAVNHLRRLITSVVIMILTQAQITNLCILWEVSARMFNAISFNRDDVGISFGLMT